MTPYKLQGETWYVRGKTAGKACRRLGILINGLERQGFTAEAVSVYCGDPETAEPWVGTVLVQEA